MWVSQTQQRLLVVLRGLQGVQEDKPAGFDTQLGNALGAAGITIPLALRKVILDAAAVPGPDAPVVIDRKGYPLARAHCAVRG